MGQGQVNCSRCNTIFDAISSLSDIAFDSHFSDFRDLPVLSVEQSVIPVDDTTEEPEVHYLSGKVKKRSVSSSVTWIFGVFCMFFLVGAQIVVFEGKRLAQTESIRPLLERICKSVTCQLPVYRHPLDIEVIERKLLAVEENTLEFHMVMVNGGRIPIELPKLKLVLNHFNGSPIAQRVFYPEEYLSDFKKGSTMPLGSTVSVRLSIVGSNRDIGGYTFSFI